jgi:hypothetical protein
MKFISGVKHDDRFEPLSRHVCLEAELVLERKSTRLPASSEAFRTLLDNSYATLVFALAPYLNHY